MASSMEPSGGAPVHEVGPPIHADVACLLVKEFAVNAGALGHDRAFPLPHGPVPSPIVIDYIAAIAIDDILGRVAADATIEQRQEPDFLNQVHHLGRIMYHSSFYHIV